jgi:uncharacterized membrane protein YbhN (UPF0104 family)
MRIVLRLLPATVALIALPWVVDLGALGRALRDVAVAPLALAVAINLATRIAAGERTYALSRAGHLPLTRAQTLEALFIANFWSLVLPGVSAGGVATVLRYRHHGVPAATALAVLAASRVLEMAAFALLAAVGWVLTATGGAGMGVHAAQVAIAGPVAAALRMLRGLPARALAAGAGWALLQGALDATTVVVLAHALDLPIGMEHALWINALSYFTILLPLSVAGLGVREAAVVVAVMPLGIGREPAVALALLMLAMTLINAAIGGVLAALAAWRGGQSKA